MSQRSAGFLRLASVKLGIYRETTIIKCKLSGNDILPHNTVQGSGKMNRRDRCVLCKPRDLNPAPLNIQHMGAQHVVDFDLEIILHAAGILIFIDKRVQGMVLL